MLSRTRRKVFPFTTHSRTSFALIDATTTSKCLLRKHNKRRQNGNILSNVCIDYSHLYRDADKSLARPGRKQARKQVRDARDFNNIETRAVIKSSPPPPPLQGKAPKEIHATLAGTLACIIPGQAKDLSASL